MGLPIDPRVIEDVRLVQINIDMLGVWSGNPQTLQLKGIATFEILDDTGNVYQGKSYESGNSKVPYFVIAENLDHQPKNDEAIKLLGEAIVNGKLHDFVAKCRYSICNTVTEGYVVDNAGSVKAKP